MERFILNDLIEWKKSKYRKPLILKGVRQVGKTWILKEFGKKYYENVAYFNFDENIEYRQFFELTKDVKEITLGFICDYENQVENLFFALSGNKLELNGEL